MTRREFLATSAAATAVVDAGGLNAAAAAPKLEGIWPWCTDWTCFKSDLSDSWWFSAWFRPGVPIKRIQRSVVGLRLPGLCGSDGRPISVDLVLFHWGHDGDGGDETSLLFEGAGPWPLGAEPYVERVDGRARRGSRTCGRTGPFGAAYLTSA